MSQNPDVKMDVFRLLWPWGLLNLIYKHDHFSLGHSWVRYRQETAEGGLTLDPEDPLKPSQACDCFTLF